MLQFQIIGNLGANAEVKSANGKSFVTFQVSSNDSYTDADGTKHESVDWVSCALSEDRGKKLLPFLVKGKQVFVSGRGSFRCYSSEKARGFVGAGNIAVERIEFLSSSTDEVPRELYERNGESHTVRKAYYVQPAEAAALCAGNATTTLLNRSGQVFTVAREGWVTPPPRQQQPQQQYQQQPQQQQYQQQQYQQQPQQQQYQQQPQQQQPQQQQYQQQPQQQQYQQQQQQYQQQPQQQQYQQQPDPFMESEMPF